jgi:purine nucleosidase
MERRNNPAYVLGRLIGQLIGTVTDTPAPTLPAKSVEVIKRQAAQNEPTPFITYYRQLFTQKGLKILYSELDPGVDDGAALLQLLAAKIKSVGSTAKNVEIVGIIPSMGNAVLSQTEQNTLQFLELTGQTDLKVFAGAIAPLADQNNQTAIEIVEQGVNATHFYGYDGEEDVGGWPRVSMKMQPQPGYLFQADTISAATPETALTLISTSALTELSMTLTELVSRDVKNGAPPGSFAKNINAISIMGGCVNPQVTCCNAPFNVPDNQKTSEANFYFDPQAAQNVFSICQQYQIPILLAPLDLTQQPGLLWTKNEVAALNQTGNPVAAQWARVTNVVPYLDALHFPNGTYPMHDLQAASTLLYPEFYTATRLAISIGDVGQIIVNENATESEKNVYVLSMPTEKQANYYATLLPAYKNFSAKKGGFFSSIAKIAGIAAAGVGGVTLGVLGAIGLKRLISKRNGQGPTESAPLISV